MKKSILSILVMSAICAPAAFAQADNAADAAATIARFQHGAALYNDMSTPDNIANDGHAEALAALEHLGVHPGDYEDAIANAHYTPDVKSLGDFVGYDISNTAPVTAEPGHFIPHGSQKVEDEANRTGNQLRRAIINKAEHSEAVAHEARFIGMVKEAPSAEDMQAEGNNEKRAAYAAAHNTTVNHAAPVVSGSRLDLLNQKLGGVIAGVQTGTDAAAADAKRIADKFEALKGADRTKDNVTRTQSQVAALNASHVQRFKQLAAAQGEALEGSNRERTASQHISEAAAQSRLTEEEQAVRDQGQDVNIQNAHSTASQALLKANSAYNYADTVHHEAMVIGGDVDTNTAKIEGVQKEQANRDRTAQQRVTDTTAQTIQAEHDAAQDKSIATISHNAASALLGNAQTSERVTGLDLAQANRDRTAQQRVTATPTKGDTGATGATGQNGKDGLNGKDGKDGITTTKVEVDSATREAVKTNRGNIHTNTKAIAANRDGVNINRQNIDKLKIDSVTYGAQIRDLASDTATAINSDRREIRSTQSKVSDNSAAIRKLNSNYSSLKSQVESDRGEYRGGIATATALAGLPQVNSNQTFMVSAAAGTFKDASAIAVGGSANINDHVVVKFGVSDSTEGDAAANIGVGYGF
ncbi:YadA-like family protein [Escherichia coli]|uniref:YadA C-terminal domain-containing protein n=1 Tax=Escherichia coli TaxID=562 RepID=UPI0037DC0038